MPRPQYPTWTPSFILQGSFRGEEIACEPRRPALDWRGRRREAVNPMRTRRAATITDLRRAVGCLPRATRIAMLEGIRSNAIIVGAYTGPDGICPMLAAHRAGARTDFISFAKAWDRFALTGSRERRARRATERELLVLTTQLEASLLDDEAPVSDLAAAIAEHEALVVSRER